MKKENEEYYIVTEVGSFGDLSETIDDPTAVKVNKKKKKKSLEEMIEESIKENSEKL